MKKNSEEYTIFQKGSFTRREVLKKALMKEGRGTVYEICGISEYGGKPIKLQLHHIDGDSNNNLKENLQFLCPNCHSQTPGWSSPHKSVPRVSDEDLLRALKESKDIKEALSKVGLKLSAGNYFRVQKLLQKI